MSTTRQHSTLIAHDKALEAAGSAIRLVLRVPAPLRPLADQVIRAASYWRAARAVTHHRQRVAVGLPPTLSGAALPRLRPPQPRPPVAAGGEFGARQPRRGSGPNRPRPAAPAEAGAYSSCPESNGGAGFSPYDSYLRLLAAAGGIDAARAERVRTRFDAVRALTWRLLNPKT
jgi:hypothetical protein